MVEGPGCKVKGEVMRRRIIQKTIVNTTVPSKSQKTVTENNACSTRFHDLCGLKVHEIRTLGKELFVFFHESQLCLRVHFLMDGSVRYGDTQQGKRQQVSDVSLLIHFTDDKLAIFKSHVELCQAEESSNRCNNLADLDICSPLFNFKRAQQRVEERSTELICDVIMNQTVLPGVGNIIKNEGLFKSGINPTSKVQDLSPELVSCLLHRLRDFSAVFYTCRKSNKPLKDHLSIYEKTNCSQCHNQVTVCKPGYLSRLTFYCSLSDGLLPKDDWQCSVCTFINHAATINCMMCASPCSEATGRKFHGKRRMSGDDSHPGPSSKRGKMENKLNELNGSLNNFNAMSNQHKDVPIKGGALLPQCLSHQKPCLKKTVMRPGANKGRIFYCCSLGGKKHCNFFQWADLNHPRCKHNKITILRRVLKQNCNNGKEFYCCPQTNKDEQCDFFQWT